ncbi:MAG: HAMP domain-containing sensor histidine kinase [Anaerolineae bacterium]|nr:HAMP domain-containing sensor histidine kinase [Anaerolineae bacterium]
MFRSIRWRLVASFVGLTLLTVAVVGVVGLSLVRQLTVQREVAFLQANASAIASQAEALLRRGYDLSRLQDLAHTAAFLSDTRVRILDSSRRVLVDTGPRTEVEELVWVDPVTQAWLQQAQATGQAPGTVILTLPTNRPWVKLWPEVERFLAENLPAGTEYIVVQRVVGAGGSRVEFRTGRVPNQVAQPTPEPAAGALAAASPRSTQVIVAPIGDPAQPWGFVELSGGLDTSRQAVDTARRAFTLAGLGATLLALAIGLLVSRSLAAPLDSLAATASRMGAGDLSARAPVTTQDEIGQVATQFNRMAERLETSFAELAAERDALRRFVADASHELRTPITALRSFVELLQGPAADDAEARAEFLAESAAQINRLEWITQNLLNLSRLDAGLVSLDLAVHDAGEIVADTAAAFKARAAEKDIALAVETPDRPLLVRCDRPRLELALTNLLDNALKFTPSGGAVTAGAKATPAGVALWVSDTGPGVDPEDLPRIFERFYRGRNNGAPGSGLGLSIVHSIVQAHHGRVTVDNRPGEGCTFTIEIPR